MTSTSTSAPVFPVEHLPSATFPLEESCHAFAVPLPNLIAGACYTEHFSPKPTGSLQEAAFGNEHWWRGHEKGHFWLSQ